MWRSDTPKQHSAIGGVDETVVVNADAAKNRVADFSTIG